MFYDKNIEKMINVYSNDIIKLLKERYNNVGVITTVYHKELVGTDIFSDEKLICSIIHRCYDLEYFYCSTENEHNIYEDVVVKYIKFYEKLKDYKLQLQK